MKTNKEIRDLINETVKYYSEDTRRRAVQDFGGCAYYLNEGEDVKCCAVGRCLIKPQDKDSKLSKTIGDTDVESLLEVYSQRIFKKDYRNFPTTVWMELQDLHDSCRYWDARQGLTPSGIDRVSELLLKYK